MGTGYMSNCFIAEWKRCTIAQAPLDPGLLSKVFALGPCEAGSQKDV